MILLLLLVYELEVMMVICLKIWLTLDGNWVDETEQCIGVEVVALVA